MFAKGELIEYHSQFLRRVRQRQRQESIVLTIDVFDSSSPVCWAVNYVRSAANFAAANWRPCPCIHVRKWSRIVYLPLSPVIVQWILCARRKKSLSAICLWLNAFTNYRYSSIRSSRRPGIGRRNLLHSSTSSASSRFHFHSTLLKKEMGNELTIVFSSDLEEHSHHKKLKEKSDLLSSNGSVRRYSARVRRCGGQLFFLPPLGKRLRATNCCYYILNV